MTDVSVVQFVLMCLGMTILAVGIWHTTPERFKAGLFAGYGVGIMVASLSYNHFLEAILGLIFMVIGFNDMKKEAADD